MFDTMAYLKAYKCIKTRRPKSMEHPAKSPKTEIFFWRLSSDLVFIILYIHVGPRHKSKCSTHLHSHLCCIVVCLISLFLQKMA